MFPSLSCNNRMNSCKSNIIFSRKSFQSVGSRNVFAANFFYLLFGKFNKMCNLFAFADFIRMGKCAVSDSFCRSFRVQSQAVPVAFCGSISQFFIKHIISLRSEIKMRGITTRRIIAKMIYLQISGLNAVMQIIRYAVRTISNIVKRCSPVSNVTFITQPKPTAIVVKNFYIRPKTITLLFRQKRNDSIFVSHLSFLLYRKLIWLGSSKCATTYAGCFYYNTTW